MDSKSRIKRLAALILAIAAVCMMTAAQAETAAADTEALFGTVNGDTYENAFIGLGCTLEGWHYYTDEEMEKVNQRTKEALAHQLDETLDLNIAVMMAERPGGMQNVGIQMQNVKAYAELYRTMGLQAMAEGSLEGFKATLETAGFTDIEAKTGETAIGEQTYTTVTGSYKLMGSQVFFKQLWDLKDHYMVTVTATTLMEDTTDEVLQKFYVLNP